LHVAGPVTNQVLQWAVENIATEETDTND